MGCRASRGGPETDRAPRPTSRDLHTPSSGVNKVGRLELRCWCWCWYWTQTHASLLLLYHNGHFHRRKISITGRSSSQEGSTPDGTRGTSLHQSSSNREEYLALLARFYIVPFLLSPLSSFSFSLSSPHSPTAPSSLHRRPPTPPTRSESESTCAPTALP